MQIPQVLRYICRYKYIECYRYRYREKAYADKCRYSLRCGYYYRYRYG